MTADAHKMVEEATEESSGGILGSIDSTKIAIGLGVLVAAGAAYYIYKRRSDSNGGSGDDNDGEDGGDDGGEVVIEEEEEDEIELADNPNDPLENDERILAAVAS